MDDSQHRRSLLLSLHGLSWRLLEAFDGIARGLWAGLWLGLLTRKHLHLVDQLSYEASKSYTASNHNLSGLFGWETEGIDHYFQDRRRLLLLGAGAGREISPLLERGFDVDAFECHEGLRKTGNALRWILGREKLDFGDDLSPGFAHFFTREAIEEELREAGWRLEFFDRRTYPHAVAIAEEELTHISHQ
ncbi:MAG: hypothetical protein K8R59_09170 [Thermoanaerobaculales bacterium]|nr:hypothetical protein [Thermoanaerobaculales bacterium]